MPNYAPNRLRRLYAATQSDPLTLPTVTGSNYCLFSKFNLDPVIGAIKRPDITGSRQELPGVRGRMSGTWGVEMSMAGNGAAGTAPDCDPFLQAAFGAAPTIVASTSVEYDLSDNIITAGLFHYRHDLAGGTALTQQIGMGATVSDATFTLGPDVAMVSMNGTCVFVLDNDNFSTYQTGWKGGLSSFPTEPASPVFHGTPVIGFTGSLTTDSDSIVELKTATIKIATGNTIVDDTFGSFIGSGVQGDTRTIDISLTLDDSDSASIIDLKQKAFTFTPIDITMVCGTIAGNIWTFTLKQVQMVNPKFTDGPKGRMRLDFGASTAHGTTLSGLNALKLVIT